MPGNGENTKKEEVREVGMDAEEIEFKIDIAEIERNW